MSGAHTRLTTRNFFGYAFLAFSIGLVTVGFGAIDLFMVGALGLQHVAAVGQADLIVTCILATFVGLTDVFAARMAADEGMGGQSLRQITLAIGFLLAVVIASLLAIALTTFVRPSLIALRQVSELIDPISDYVVCRLWGAAPFLIYIAASEALKISGLRARAFHILVIGFLVNAVLNGLFLYTQVSSFFKTPEQAVATATVLAHILMCVIASLLWIRSLKPIDSTYRSDLLPSAVREMIAFLKVSPGLGMRVLNDYASSVVPMLFIGTMNTSTVAAAAIATKIYTIFCRLPQALFSASYVYYCYGLEAWTKQRTYSEERGVVKKLFKLTAAPTLLALLVALVVSRLIVSWFGASAINLDLTNTLLVAYLVFVPAYIYEQFYAELLTAHTRSSLLFWTSTLVTYGITIPLAYYSIFYLQSPLFAILSTGLSSCVLALIYTLAFKQQEKQVMSNA